MPRVGNDIRRLPDRLAALAGLDAHGVPASCARLTSSPARPSSPGTCWSASALTAGEPLSWRAGTVLTFRVMTPRVRRVLAAQKGQRRDLPRYNEYPS